MSTIQKNSEEKIIPPGYNIIITSKDVFSRKEVECEIAGVIRHLSTETLEELARDKGILGVFHLGKIVGDEVELISGFKKDPKNHTVELTIDLTKEENYSYLLNGKSGYMESNLGSMGPIFEYHKKDGKLWVKKSSVEKVCPEFLGYKYEAYAPIMGYHRDPKIKVARQTNIDDSWRWKNN